jgi:hypothetical protein
MESKKKEQSCQRGLKRHQVTGVVEVYDRATQQYIGRLVNIHSEGMMLMGDQLLSIEKIYQLDLILAQHLDGVDKIQLGIDCFWVREAGDGSPHWAGCRIIDASDEALSMVDKLVNAWGE